MKTTKGISGVSLIEVLVALVILTMGVLSVVALQLVAKRNNSDAGQREIAARLAYDMLERMRSNNGTTALRTYLEYAARGVGREQQGSEPQPACASGSSCSTSQLAIHDVWAWEQLIDGATERLGTGTTAPKVGGLTSATACVTGPAGGGSGDYNVAIAWRSNVTLPSNTAQPCGLGTAALYGADDEYRRVVSVAGYIAIR